MSTGRNIVACPCGGHALTLAPDTPPVGTRAAFTCPACKVRRTFTRTEAGAVFDTPEPAPATPAKPPAALGARPQPGILPAWAPTPVPGGVAVVLALLPEGAWRQAVTEAFPAPGWHVLWASAEAAQNQADINAHLPAVVIAAAGPSAEALAGQVAALPGRARERMAFFLVGDYPESDALAAFAQSADALFDVNAGEGAAPRLRAASDRRKAQPSLFETP